jgi:hypothetical protein
MNTIIVLLALATTINRLPEDLTLDGPLAILPMHRRTDWVVYPHFPRGNNCGNGVVVSPLLWIQTAMHTVLASILHSAEHSSIRRLFHMVSFSREREMCIITRESQGEEVL